MPFSSSQLERGYVLGGYRIDELISRGGMGVVYRATNVALNRIYALKVLAPELAGDEQFRDRFKREMRVAASLHHPSVVGIHYAGEQDGLLFLVMDFVHGTDLRQLLIKYGALDPERAVELLAQMASALDAAHGGGLVHRDVKPANVLITVRDGEETAYLTDFGLAKRSDTVGGLTKKGAVVGTVDYMAPEQITGSPTDARTDVYALGCVFFEMLSGKVPYERENSVATLFAHVHSPPPRLDASLSETYPDFDTVLDKAMAKEPDERYLSAGDLSRAAAAALRGMGYTAPPTLIATGDAKPADIPTPAAPILPEPAATRPPDPGQTFAPEPAATTLPEPAATRPPDPGPTIAPDPAPTILPEPEPTRSPEPATGAGSVPGGPTRIAASETSTPPSGSGTPPPSETFTPPPRETFTPPPSGQQTVPPTGPPSYPPTGPPSYPPSEPPASSASGAQPQPPPRSGNKRRLPVALALLVLVGAIVAAVIVLGSGSSAPSAGGQRLAVALSPVPTNRVTGSGSASVQLKGDVATVKLSTSGLLNGAPHLIHIHAGGLGQCPPASAARLHNGHLAISTGNGIKFYGPPQVALTLNGDSSASSNLAFQRFPSVGDINYSRTVTVTPVIASLIRGGNAVIVVHGIDYDHSGTYDEVLGRSDLATQFTGDSTAPAICGHLANTPSTASASTQGTVYTASLRPYIPSPSDEAAAVALVCQAAASLSQWTTALPAGKLD